MTRTATDVLAEKRAAGWTDDRIRVLAMGRNDQELLALLGENTVAKKTAARRENRHCETCGWKDEVPKESQICATCNSNSSSWKPRKDTLTHAPQAEQLYRLPVEQIVPSPQNCDRDDLEKIQRLALSMQEQGLLQAIMVRPLVPEEFEAHPETANYEIVAGERRWRAARHLGWTHIAASVRVLSEGEAQGIRLVENLQREDVPPMQQSEGVVWMLEQYGNDFDEVGKRLGYSASWVRLRARLSSLSPAWRAELSKPDCGHDRVRELVSYQEEIAKLPAAAQDRLLAKRSLMHCTSIAGLREQIGRELRILSESPWSASSEKRMPASMRCKTCLNRSDRDGNRSLFAELVPDDEARCTDPDCWDRKVCGWLDERFRQELKRDGDVRLIVTEFNTDVSALSKAFCAEVHPKWGYTLDSDVNEDDRETMPDEHDLRPALIVSGTRLGEVVQAWFPRPCDDDEDDDLAQAQSETPEEKAARIEKRKADEAATALRVRQINAARDVMRKAIFPDWQGGAWEEPDVAPAIACEDMGENLLRLIAIEGFQGLLTEDPAEHELHLHIDLVERMWTRFLQRLVGDWGPRPGDGETLNQALRLGELIGGEELRQACKQAAEAAKVDSTNSGEDSPNSGEDSPNSGEGFMDSAEDDA